MPDEVTPVVAAPSTPAVDPKALEAMVQGAVRSSIESLVKEGQTRQAELDAAKAAEPRVAQPGPFDEMFKPALEPVLKSVRDAEARANMAADAVNFYTDPGNAEVIAYRGKIEEVVQVQAKKGNIISRQDAWNWLRGGALYDEITKKTLTAHETKLEEARKATAAGAGAPAAVRFTKPIDEMKTDELGDALRGVTF